jgi:hypothetical protein
MHSSRSLAAALVAFSTAAAGMVVAGPSQGTPLESGSEEIEFTEVVNKFCDTNGLRVRIEGSGTLTYRLATRGPDGNVFYAEHLDAELVITNVRNGKFIVSRENSSFRDLHVTENADGTYTVVYFGTGNAVVYDSSGTAIGRNPGQSRFEAVLDLNGTPEDPDDDEVISEELILGSTGRSDDFCTVAVPALT